LRIRYRNARAIRLVYEAGFSGFWLYRRLQQDGYDCIVTSPNRIPRSTNKIKTDKRDAEKLARFHSSGHLKAIAVPSPQIESERRILRHRGRLVKKQTRQKNEIKSFLFLHDISKPETIKTCWSKAYIEWLKELRFEFESDAFLLTQMIEHLVIIRQELARLTLYLRTLSRNPDYKNSYDRITKLRGVGLITAMTFLLELFDLIRFRNSRHLSSYLGLTPSQHSSGEHVRLGHITREGNAYLRGVLIESAWTVIKHDPHLRNKYNRIRARSTNGNKAIVAVARSLAVRLRRCLLDETDYVVGIC
jgi:transposase